MAEAPPMPALLTTISILPKRSLIRRMPSSTRIGRAIALELACRGATIAVHYRSSANEAEQIAASRGAAFQADLTDVAAIKKMFQEIETKLGGIDILVNSASVFSPATADE